MPRVSSTLQFVAWKRQKFINICQHLSTFPTVYSIFIQFSSIFTFFPSFPSVSMVLLVYPTMFCFLIRGSVPRSDSSWWWHLCGAGAGAVFFFTQFSCLFNVNIKFSKCLECLETFQVGHILRILMYTGHIIHHNTS